MVMVQRDNDKQKGGLMDYVKQTLVSSIQSIIGTSEGNMHYIATHVRDGKRVPLRLLDIQGARGRRAFELETLRRYTTLCVQRGETHSYFLMEVFMLMAVERGLKEVGVVLHQRLTPTQIVASAEQVFPLKDWLAASKMSDEMLLSDEKHAPKVMETVIEVEDEEDEEDVLEEDKGKEGDSDDDDDDDWGGWL